MEKAKVFHPSKSKYLVFTADYLIPLFVCLGVIAMIYLALYSPFFKISTVNCSLDYQDCKGPSLLAELDKLNGQNIFTLSPGSITKRLTSGDFTIREAHLKRELPGTVNIDLQSVYPVVALQIKGDQTWVILDPKYRVIGTRSESPNVPTVVVSGPLTLTVGKTPTDGVIIQSLGLARRLFDEIFLLSSITLVDPDTLELALSDGRMAIFTPKKDELEQLRALQAILGETTMIKGVKTIDVRFGRPVLR